MDSISAEVSQRSTPGPADAETPREIIGRTRGRRHGAITRVLSPGDVGELIKPFVFLDYFDFEPTGASIFPMHPHSGIATITVLLSGDLRYEDTTGASGVLAAGSVEWMRAGNGVWHDGGPVGRQRFHGYQVWVALPEHLENAAPQSQYLPPEAVATHGPARVILGSLNGAQSRVQAPAGMNLLHVHLAAGERWLYAPPAGHQVAWAHVNLGAVQVSGERLEGELAVFAESQQAIEFVAENETDFIFGSAVKHPHELVLGYYSVHTSKETLERGETEIARIGQRLRSEGRVK